MKTGFQLKGELFRKAEMLYINNFRKFLLFSRITLILFHSAHYVTFNLNLPNGEALFSFFSPFSFSQWVSFGERGSLLLRGILKRSLIRRVFIYKQFPTIV